jgi:uncharacterized repeat protein (TIGR01451 family)
VSEELFVNQFSAAGWRNGISRSLIAVALFLIIASSALAQTPPYWNGGTPPKNVNNVNGACGTPGCAVAPAPWPADAQWIAYSWGTTYPDITQADKHPIRDPRVQDPSNGGTSPQNYVNVSSGCFDKSRPSIYYYFNTATQTIYFRWRVEQIANSYATGTSAGAFASGDPWKSALWTVFFDITGDGFRDFAAHLDGSSGSPSAPIDTLRSIWSLSKSNSIDYVADPAIKSLFVNPTGFVHGTAGSTNNTLLQFDGNGAPTTIQWPNGASETTWDYGTTRAINVSTSSCSEFLVDYQIPLVMLNSSAFTGGKQFTVNTPFQFLFATANSLNNPFQKDIVWEGSFVCDATSPGPFGDALTLANGIIPQPISTSITAGSASNCAVPVTAQIMDALTVNNCQSISQLVDAQFKYWYDTNGNGLPDEPSGSWVNIGNPTVPVGTTVTASWDLATLIQGQYLLALEIQDNRGHLTRTWESNAGLANVKIGEEVISGKTTGIYSNAPTAGLSAATLGINYAKVTISGVNAANQPCGAAPPTVSKTHSIDGGANFSNTNVSTAAGSPLTYRLRIANNSTTSINVTKITDTLPAGFTYQSTNTNAAVSTLLSGGGSVSSSPAPGSTGTIAWDLSGVTLGANATRDFIFSVNAGTSAGTFYNTGTFTTSVGDLTATDTSGVTVTTAALTVSKFAALDAAPATPVSTFAQNDVVRFTITYTNTSSTTVTGINISDPVPAQFTITGSSPSGTVAGNTVSWTNAQLGSGGSLAPGQSFSVTITATAAAAGSFTNTATVCPSGCNAPPVQASTSGLVTGPVLAINKTASTSIVVAPGTMSYVIQYANVGTAAATGVAISDSWTGAGFTLSSFSGTTLTPVCVQSGTTVNCTMTPSTLAAGATGSVTLNFTVTAAAGTYTDTATVSATNAISKQATFDVTVVSNACSTSTFYFRNQQGAVSSNSSYSVGYVRMTASGANYATAPTATFNGTGSGAAASTYGVTGTGGVYGVNVTDGGSGYAPITTGVTIAGGGGSGALGTPILTNEQYLALTTSGTNNAIDSGERSVTGTVFGEIMRFYGPTYPESYILENTTPATVKVGWTVTAATPARLKWQATLAMYNPATEAMVQIASNNEASVTVSLNTPTNRTLTLTIPANTILPAGWRLVWIISASDNGNGSATSKVRLHFDGNTANTQSYGTVCMTPVRVSLTKRADRLAITPGVDSLSYTISYANTSSVAVPQVVITDPLPSGMTHVSSTNVAATSVHSIAVTSGGSGYNQSSPPAVTITGAGTGATARANVVGGAVIGIEVLTSGSGYTGTPTVTIAAPVSGTTATATATMTGTTVAGNTVTFRLGTLAAGATGSVAITASTSQSMANTPAVNTATLSNLYGPNVTASTSTLITRPDVRISKRASVTNRRPGEAFTYTLDVVNTGTGTATSVAVSDTLPSYILSTGSTASTGSVSGIPGGAASTLSWTIGTMSAGASATLTVNVQVATTGVPAGQTALVNTGSVVDSYNTTPRTSSATITVTATPTLTLTETAVPSANRVVFVNVTNGGSYATPPTVNIAGNGCSGVTAEVSTNPPYVAGVSSGPYTVIGVTITNAGSGCTGDGLTNAPTVTFSSGTAAAQAYVGPAPGDTITYTVKVRNIGDADATGVVVTGSVPAVTSYTSGGTYSSGSVISNVGTLIPQQEQTLVYVVTVGNLPYSYSSPFGVTSIGQIATATSTNATAPTPVTATLTSGVSPRYSMDKSPNGGTLGYPLTTVAGSVTNSATISVASSALLSAGDYIALFNSGSWSVVRIVSISGANVTLSANVTASAGTNVIPVEEYTLSYANVGNATGANMVVRDELPANLVYGGYPAGVTAPTSAPAIGSSGTISWSIANLPSGGSGTVEFLAFPLAAGQYTNTAIIEDGSVSNRRNATDTATTTFGALNPAKVTTTPQRKNGAPDNTAHYTITVQNPLPSTTATNVTITDNLPAGFTYVAGSSVGAGEPSCTVPCTNPVWSGLSIAPGATLTIEFDALVGSGVPTGIYDNEILVSGSIPSLVFDSLATTQEDVQVCDAPPVITAPSPVCGNTSSVASVPRRPQATYVWSITGGTITNGSTGTIDRVVLGSGGSGYATAPAISFTGGGGSGATATATVSGGVITAITIDNPGSGYTSTPTVVITPTSGGSGATAAAVVGTGVVYTAGNSGNVTLQVTVTEGSCSTVASKVITVNASPVITTQPASKTACNNASVTFSATVTGASSYQWQRSTNSGASWANLAGETASSYTFTATNADSGYQYRVIATGASGCAVVSNAATLNVTCALDLELTTNSVSSDPVFAGNNVTFTQLVTNVSSNATTGPITVTQNVPANTTFVSMTPPAGWTCTTPAVGGTGAITCTTSNVLAAGANTGNFVLVLNVPASTTDGVVVTDTVTVSVGGGDVDSVASNNSKTTTTNVLRRIDIAVLKSNDANDSGYGAGYLYPGNPPSAQPLKWAINVSNGGPSRATGVVIQDTMPPYFTYSSSAASQGNCTFDSIGKTLTCTLGTMEPSGTATIDIDGTVLAESTQIVNTAAASYNEFDTNTSNDSASSMVVMLAPTAVEMFSMDAVQTKKGVTLMWETSFEVDNLGFHVWRQNGAGLQKEKVNPHVITGSALFSKKATSESGRRYRFVDTKPVAGATYWIEDVDLKGVRTLHGPIVPHSGTDPFDGAVGTDPDPSVGSTGGIFTTAPGMGVTPSLPTGNAATRQATQWSIAGSRTAKLVITTPGWYRITKADLVAAGLDPGSTPRNISLFTDGVEVPIEVSEKSNGKFDAADSIEFYAHGIDIPSTGGRIYYVTVGKGNAARVKTPSGKTAGGSTPPSSFPSTFRRIERTLFFPALTTNGDRENFFGAVVYSEPSRQSLTVSNLDSTGGKGSLQVVLQGAIDNMNHSVSVMLNGAELGPVYYKNQERHVATLTVPAGVLVNGENTLTFTATGGWEDISVVESAQLTYPHLYRADENALSMTAPAGAAVNVGGFTNATIRVVDLTDPSAPLAVPSTVTTAADGTSSVSFVAPESGSRTLFAFAANRVMAPAQVVLNEPSSWNASTNAANLVILTNRAFVTAANTLKQARDAQGIKTAVVDVQNVYDEFAYGQHGPKAIRDFLQHATKTWSVAPHYVILLGDATYDPRNYYEAGAADYVPSKLSATHYLKSASDDWFADFNDTGLPSLAIGRIPVRTAEEANGVIAKIVGRGTPASTKISIITDDPEGVPFDRGGDRLASMVRAPFTANRVSFAATSDPHRAVLGAFNSGALLLNYLGHGSIEGWSNSNAFTSADAAALSNRSALPFVVAMNCLNGYFDDPWYEGLAESLLKNPNGGAIAVWASSALTSPDQQLRMNTELYRQLLSGTPISIGDAILKAKQATTDRDVRRTFILFGDPTITLK